MTFNREAIFEIYYFNFQLVCNLLKGYIEESQTFKIFHEDLDVK